MRHFIVWDESKAALRQQALKFRIEEVAQELVKTIREFRPQVIITYDEIGGYPHPDHLMVHRGQLLPGVEALLTGGDGRERKRGVEGQSGAAR